MEARKGMTQRLALALVVSWVTSLFMITVVIAVISVM